MQGHRPAAGQAVRSVLRLHVLRHDAPVRGGGADPRRGHLTFADASPAAGTAPDGTLFRSENGNLIQQSTWWQVWQKVRPASLSAEELASPLLRRPYDLRHSGVTWRLNSGVPATEVAAWAGHSVEVLTRVYARCVTGLEDVWIGRMDDALRLEGGQGAGEGR